MLVSLPAKVAFIHNHKTGGVSTRHWMIQQYPETHYDGHGHESAAEAVARVGLETWDQYFSFGFVRNPWARMLSWWCMFTERPTAYAESPTWKYARTARTFEEFIFKCRDTIYEPGAAKSFVRPQLQYFTDAAGKQLVDFIGQYENLQADIDKIAELTGVPRRQLEHHNRTNVEKDYRAHYTWVTKAVVGQRFAEDIERFKYTF